MPITLHQRLTRSLLDEMASGTYREGQRFLSLRMIERLWRVSEPTARTSLQKLSDAGLVAAESRRGYFLQLGFQQKAQLLLKRNRTPALLPTASFEQKAKAMRQGGGGRVAVLLETGGFMDETVHSEIPPGVRGTALRFANAFKRQCQKERFEPCWYLYNQHFSEWLRAELTHGDFGGVVVFCRSNFDAVVPTLEPVIQRRLPIVFNYDDCRGLPVHSIHLNNVGVGYDAFRHLYRLGHRRIAVAIRESPPKAAQSRLKGCMLAQSQERFHAASIQVIKVNPAKPLAHEAIFSDRDTRPTALFATESSTVRYLKPLFDHLSLSIPSDLSVIVSSGHDRPSGWDRPFDSMQLNVAAKIGRLAAQHLRKIQAGEVLEKSLLLDVAYIRRGSTALINTVARKVATPASPRGVSADAIATPGAFFLRTPLIQDRSA